MREHRIKKFPYQIKYNKTDYLQSCEKLWLLEERNRSKRYLIMVGYN